MQKFKTLSDAIALAEYAHRNQQDRAGQPYIDHPKRVLAKVQAQGGLPYVQMAAVLHDVTEDTAFTPAMLLDLGFSEAVVELVKVLDRDESRRYHFASDYPGGLNMTSTGQDAQVKWFYYDVIRKNAAARVIKLADIEDNLTPWRLSYLSESTQIRLGKKYAQALRMLNHEESLELPDSFYVPWLPKEEE